MVLIGIAQQKASVWRSWPQKGQENKAHSHMDWGERWPLRIISISTFGIPNGVQLFGRQTRRRHFQSGCG